MSLDATEQYFSLGHGLLNLFIVNLVRTKLCWRHGFVAEHIAPATADDDKHALDYLRHYIHVRIPCC